MSEKETTSRTDNHFHMWSRRMKFTSLDIGKRSGLHKHKINLLKGIAMPVIKGGHWHKLEDENGKRKHKRKSKRNY